MLPWAERQAVHEEITRLPVARRVPGMKDLPLPVQAFKPIDHGTPVCLGSQPLQPYSMVPVLAALSTSIAKLEPPHERACLKPFPSSLQL